MKLPDPVKDIIRRYVAKFPLWEMEQGPEAEERARQWSTKLAEQVVFEHPGQGWGKKRADGGRPISKDAIAKQVSDRLHSWDLMLGAGTGRPQLLPDPDSEDITGQVFVPVPAVNHLGETTPEPPPKPPTVPPVDDSLLAALRHLGERLEAQARQLADVGEDVGKLLRRPAPTAPTYAGIASGPNPLPFGPRTLNLSVELVPKVVQDTTIPQSPPPPSADTDPGRLIHEASGWLRR